MMKENEQLTKQDSGLPEQSLIASTAVDTGKPFISWGELKTKIEAQGVSNADHVEFIDVRAFEGGKVLVVRTKQDLIQIT